MLTGVSEVEAGMLTGVSDVEAQYVGFDAKRLPSVLRAILRDLRKDHPGLGRIRIPSILVGSPWDFGARPKVLETMRTFLAGVACDDYKIIAFDAGVDETEANGYIAIMMASSFELSCEPRCKWTARGGYRGLMSALLIDVRCGTGWPPNYIS